jgi:hypothetical protein
VGTDEYGPWEPLSLTEVQTAFDGAPFRWWISGGIALDLFAGRSWRVHEDTDVGVLRRDLHSLRVVTKTWDIQVAAAGRLSTWSNQELYSEQHENNLWCRKDQNQPWCLDVTIGEGNDECWIYRRDPEITATWDSAVLFSTEGIPYLAPEIQLLYKSKDIRDKDETDAREVIPILDAARQEWLLCRLSPEHEWRQIF